MMNEQQKMFLIESNKCPINVIFVLTINLAKSFNRKLKI